MAYGPILEDCTGSGEEVYRSNNLNEHRLQGYISHRCPPKGGSQYSGI